MERALDLTEKLLDSIHLERCVHYDLATLPIVLFPFMLSSVFISLSYAKAYIFRLFPMMKLVMVLVTYSLSQENHNKGLINIVQPFSMIGLEKLALFTRRVCLRKIIVLTSLSGIFFM